MHRSVAIFVLASIAAASAGPLLNKCVLEPNTDPDRFAKLSTLNELYGELLSTESDGFVYHVSICRPVPRSFYDSGKLVGAVKMTAEGAPRHSIGLGNIDRTNVMVNGNDIVLSYVGDDGDRDSNDSCKGLRWKTYVTILCDPLVTVDILTLIDEIPDQPDTCEVWFELKTSKTCNKKPEIPSVIWKDDLPHHEKQIDLKKDAERKEINSNQNPLRDQSFNNENSTFAIVTDSLQIEDEVNNSNENYGFGFKYLYSYITPFMSTIPKFTNKNNSGPHKKKDQLHQNVFEDKSADNPTNNFNGSKFDSNTDTEKSHLNQNLNPNHNNEGNYGKKVIFPISEGSQNLIEILPKYRSANYVKHSDNERNEINSNQNHLKNNQLSNVKNENVDEKNKHIQFHKNYNFPHNKNVETHQSINLDDKLSKNQNENFHTKNEPAKDKIENGTITQITTKSNPLGHMENENTGNSLNRNNFFNNKLFNDPKEPNHENKENSRNINGEDEFPGHENRNYYFEDKVTKEEIKNSDSTQTSLKHQLPSKHGEQWENGNIINTNSNHNTFRYNEEIENSDEKIKRIDRNKINSEPKNSNNRDNYDSETSANRSHDENKDNFLNTNSVEKNNIEENEKPSGNAVEKINSNHMAFENKSTKMNEINDFDGHKNISDREKKYDENDSQNPNVGDENSSDKTTNLEGKHDYYSAKNISKHQNGSVEGTKESNSNRTNSQNVYPEDGSSEHFTENTGKKTGVNKSDSSTPNSDDNSEKKPSDNGDEIDRKTDGNSTIAVNTESSKNGSSITTNGKDSSTPRSDNAGKKSSKSGDGGSQQVAADGDKDGKNGSKTDRNSTVADGNSTDTESSKSEPSKSNDTNEKESSKNGDGGSQQVAADGDNDGKTVGKNGSKTDRNSTVTDGNSTIAVNTESSMSEPSKNGSSITTNGKDSSTPQSDNAGKKSSKNGDGGSQQVTADGDNDGKTVEKTGSKTDRNSTVADGNSTNSANVKPSENESSTTNESDSSTPNGTPRSDNGEKTSSKSGDGGSQQVAADGDNDGKTVGKNGSKNHGNSTVIANNNNGTIAVNTEPSGTESANDSNSDRSISPAKKIVNGSVSDANGRELNGTGTYQTNNVHKIVRSVTTEPESNAETSESSIVSKIIKSDNSNSEGDPKTTDNTDGGGSGNGFGFGSLFSKLFPNGFPPLSASTIFAGLGSLSVISALVGTAVNRFYYKRTGTDQIPFKGTFQSVMNKAKDFSSKILCCFGRGGDGAGGGDDGSDEPKSATERSPLLQPKNVSAPKVVDETSRTNGKRTTSSDSGRSESGDNGSNYGSTKNEENVSCKKYRKKKSKSTVTASMSTSDSGPDNEKRTTESAANDVSPTFASIFKTMGKLAIKRREDVGDAKKTAETLKSDDDDNVTPVPAPRGADARKRVDDVRADAEIGTESPDLRPLKTDELQKQSSNANDTVAVPISIREPPKSGTDVTTDVTISEDKIDIAPYEEMTENSDFGTPPTTPIVRDTIELPENADGNRYRKDSDAPQPEPESIDDLIGKINEEITEKFKREIQDLELEKTDNISDGNQPAVDVKTPPIGSFNDTKTISDDKDSKKVPNTVDRTNENEEPCAESSRDVISLPYNRDYYKRSESKLKFLGLDVKKEEDVPPPDVSAADEEKSVKETGAPEKTAAKYGGEDNDDAESVAGPEDFSYMDSGADSVQSDVFEDTLVDQEPRDATSTGGGRSGSLSPSTDSQTGTAASVDGEDRNDRKKFGLQLGIGKSGVNVSVGEKKMGIGRMGLKFGKRDARGGGGGGGGEDDGMTIKVDKSGFKMNRNKSAAKSKGGEPAANETEERSTAAGAAKKFKKTLSMPNFNVFKRSISTPPNFAEIAENEASTSSAGVGGKPSSSSDRSAGLLIFGKSRSKSTGFLETEDVSTTDVNVLSSFIDFERQASASNLSTGYRVGERTDSGPGNLFQVDTATAVATAAENKFRPAALLSSGENAIKSLTAGALGAVVKPSFAGTSSVDLKVGGPSVVEKDGDRKSTVKSDGAKKSATAKTGRGKKKNKSSILNRPF